MVEKLKNPKGKVTIALVGKYVSLHDAYISVVEALKHGGIANSMDVEIKWVDSEKVTENNVSEAFEDADGLLVPGGFGDRGIEGMITSIRYARENNVPFLGICLGMQMAVVEFARNVLGYEDADSVEFHPETQHPMIALMPEQTGVENLGGTLRLGAYRCILDKKSKSYKMYGSEDISERHRHRYEVNNDYREELKSHGMALVGIVEMCELSDNLFFVGTQAHPELKSRPNRPAPLFAGLIGAAVKYKKIKAARKDTKDCEAGSEETAALQDTEKDE